MKSIIKVGDTPMDVAHVAGMWAVSVISHGNQMGLSEADLTALSPCDRKAKTDAARARLALCGPHYIIDTTAELLPIIDDINSRLARGERP